MWKRKQNTNNTSPPPPIEVHKDQNRSLHDAHIVLPQGWPNVNEGFC
jgi:hypothetical protein